MNKIIFKIDSREDIPVFTANGENILDAARNANIIIDAPCSGALTCGKCRVKLLEGSLESAEFRHITDKEMAEGWRLACSSFVDGDAVLLVPDISGALKLRVEPVDTDYTPNDDKTFGLAVDIGTTTVAALLVDLENGEKVARADTGNAQIHYGADVINRIIQQSKQIRGKDA